MLLAWYLGPLLAPVTSWLNWLMFSAYWHQDFPQLFPILSRQRGLFVLVIFAKYLFVQRLFWTKTMCHVMSYSVHVAGKIIIICCFNNLPCWPDIRAPYWHESIRRSCWSMRRPDDTKRPGRAQKTCQGWNIGPHEVSPPLRKKTWNIGLALFHGLPILAMTTSAQSLISFSRY